jgi:uncharacterized PurR-regulated membrane protein YhhQ (DUF165 family)
VVLRRPLAAEEPLFRRATGLPNKHYGEEPMKSKIAMTMFATVVFGVTTGCAAQPAPEDRPAAQEAATEASHTAASMTVTGNVVEIMDAATYTYAVLLESALVESE